MLKLIGLIILGLPISIVVVSVIAVVLNKVEDKDMIKSWVTFLYIIYVGVALITHG